MTFGATVRVAGLAVAVWMKPSGHVSTHGADPVSATERTTGAPGQDGPPPVTTAVGGVPGVIVALPETVPAQLPASVTDASV